MNDQATPEVTPMITCRHDNATVRAIAWCINKWIVAGIDEGE